MDELLQKILTFLITTTIVIIIIAVGWRLLMNTPVGKGLNQFLGGVGAVLGAVGEQLDDCVQNGIFGSGCYLGWGGIAIGGVYIVAKVGQYFISNKQTEDYQAETGKSLEGAVNDFRQYAKSKGVDFNKIDSEDPTGKGIVSGKVLATAARNKFIETLDKNDPDYQAKVNKAKDKWEKARSQIDEKNDLDDEGSKESDAAADRELPPIDP